MPLLLPVTHSRNALLERESSVGPIAVVVSVLDHFSAWRSGSILLIIIIKRVLFTLYLFLSHQNAVKCLAVDWLAHLFQKSFHLLQENEVRTERLNRI